MNTRTMMAMAVAAVAMSACGGAAKVGGGKQGAAQALHAMSGPTKASANRAATPVDLTDLSVSCAKGGTAKLSNFAATVDTSGGGVKVVQSFTMELAACGLATSEAGDALYTGSVNVAQSVITDAAGVHVDQSFKGKVTLSGAFDDFLDTDVSEKVDVAQLGASGNVSVVLKGSLTTSSGSYAYDEAVNVNGGSIAIDSSTK